MMQMKKTLNRLDGFHITGRGTTPGGGFTLAVSSGRHVVLVICKQDRKRFVATEPWCATCREEGNPENRALTPSRSVSDCRTTEMDESG